MPQKSFYIKESELDDYQVIVLQRKTDKPFIVKGCAGSGKSILALHKVKQIQEEKMGSFYFILFTKTLKRYMEDGIDSIGLKSDRVTYHWYWKNKLNAPNADYIVVDEAQDFSAEDIALFISKANKALILYGDSAQQIYKFMNPPPISMEQIAVQTGFQSDSLVFNHRLPKKIARLAEQIIESDDLEKRCKNEGVELPKILQFNDFNSQLDEIVKIINNTNLEDVGILFRHNNEVERAESYFASKNFEVEVKSKDKMNLDFKTTIPKVTTYHSSKGLQFETVFIPNCNIVDDDDKTPLYVAITRSYHSLFIMHSGDLSPFISNISEILYETSLEVKASMRL